MSRNTKTFNRALKEAGNNARATIRSLHLAIAASDGVPDDEVQAITHGIDYGKLIMGELLSVNPLQETPKEPETPAMPPATEEPAQPELVPTEEPEHQRRR